MGCALAALLTAVLCSGRARAEPARSTATSDAEVTLRLAYLERVLERDEPRLRLWRDSWVSIFAGLALAQGGLALGATDGGVRAVSIAGGIKSALAFAGVLAAPATGRTAATRLRAEPASTPAERRAKLRLAESLLRASAGDERLRRSWIPLAAGAVLNASGACVIWALHRPVEGWLGLGSGVVVGQIQYWSQPTGAVASWEAYAAGRFREPVPRAAPAALRVSVIPGPGGLAIAGSF